MTQSLDAIREALKPFAEIAEKIHPEWSSARSIVSLAIDMSKVKVGDYRRAAEAYASLSDQSAGDGWKLVPVEPSKDLQWIGFNAAFPDEQATDKKMRIVATSYRAMIAALSPAPASKGPMEAVKIEQVAKALYDDDRKDPGAMPWEKICNYNPDLANEFRSQARAALGAMQHE